MYAAPEVETSPTVFRIDQNLPNGEYLLIENRQPVGFESVMPQGGLAIWHIDESKSSNTEEGYPGQDGWPENNKHYKIALFQADGNFDLESYRAAIRILAATLQLSGTPFTCQRMDILPWPSTVWTSFTRPG